MRRIVLAMELMALGLAFAAAGGCAWYESMRYQPRLDAADAAFDRGDVALAAMLYENLADRSPTMEQRESALMREGSAYYALSSLHDAQDVFERYLKEFPAGSHRAEARDYLDKIAILLGDSSPAGQTALDHARRDRKRLEALNRAHPLDPDVLVALGDLYYDLGERIQAVDCYYKALKLKGVYEERDLIRQRMMLNAAGQPVPRTPEKVDQLMREQRPLVVFNTHDYPARAQGSGGAWGSQGDLAIYNVTGLVRNQSTRLLHGVRVEVRFLNMGGQVLDVKQYVIGTMAPGEVRPFRAGSTSYDNLYNIASYDCVASCQD